MCKTVIQQHVAHIVRQKRICFSQCLNTKEQRHLIISYFFLKIYSLFLRRVLKPLCEKIYEHSAYTVINWAVYIDNDKQERVSRALVC